MLTAFEGAVMKEIQEPDYPLTITQQKRMVFLLRKYLDTVNRSKARGGTWDLTKCDDETRKLFAQIGAGWRSQ